MKMKKFICLVLILTLSLSLCACGGGDNNAEIGTTYTSQNVEFTLNYEGKKI